MEFNTFYIIMEALQSIHKHIPKYTDQQVCIACYHIATFLLQVQK